MQRRVRVGVLRGGPSNEYEVSLQTGAAVLKAIREKLEGKYEPVDVLVDRNGDWHIHGRNTSPLDYHHHFDFAWNSLHGQFGEDGKLQHFLETHKIPFAGSGSLGSAIGMNKAMTKKIFQDHGIKTPFWKEV